MTPRRWRERRDDRLEVFAGLVMTTAYRNARSSIAPSASTTTGIQKWTSVTTA